MKANKTFKVICGASIVVMSINAWSQTSEPAAASTLSSMAPAAGGTAKAIRQANRALSKKVFRALVKSRVQTDGINVVAKNGAVTLEGSVPDSTQISKAAEVTKGVPGVTSVNNSLTIKEVGQ